MRVAKRRVFKARASGTGLKRSPGDL
jgi:hypothetical protein